MTCLRNHANLRIRIRNRVTTFLKPDIQTSSWQFLRLIFHGWFIYHTYLLGVRLSWRLSTRSPWWGWRCPRGACRQCRRGWPLGSGHQRGGDRNARPVNRRLSDRSLNRLAWKRKENITGFFCAFSKKLKASCIKLAVHFGQKAQLVGGSFKY